jgi:dihydroneopterin aldolase / 2-amino-4-hydroxy-6-hydroxymethyldihydropteridine diphosphokinase / dihydropteroate synthase
MSTQSSDKIVVTDLSLALTISLDHWSRPLPSPHLINFVIHHSVVASGSSDTLPSTINYSTASKTVTALAQSKAWDSLELCAEAVAEVLQSLGAARVCVRIKATKCLAGGQVEVELWRGGAGPEKDSITISDLGVRCIIGVNPQERLEKQLVVIDAKFPLEAPFSTPFPHTKLAEAVHDVRSHQALTCLSLSG